MSPLRLTRPIQAAFMALGLLSFSLGFPHSAEGQLTPESKLDRLQAGFHRMKIGAVDVIELSDGTSGFDVVKLLSRPREAERLLAKAGLKSPVEGSVNAFLIQL